MAVVAEIRTAFYPAAPHRLQIDKLTRAGMERLEVRVLEVLLLKIRSLQAWFRKKPGVMRGRADATLQCLAPGVRPYHQPCLRNSCASRTQ
jgi:hypothetical protein